MIDPMVDEVELECRTLTRYLIGEAPSPYVVMKYRGFHAAGPLSRDPADRFDWVLVRVARWGGVATQGADLVARLARPTSLLRHKLVALLAILESAPGTAPSVQRSGGGALAAVGAVGLAGLSSAIVLVVAGLGLGLAWIGSSLLPLRSER